MERTARSGDAARLSLADDRVPGGDAAVLGDGESCSAQPAVARCSTPSSVAVVSAIAAHANDTTRLRSNDTSSLPGQSLLWRIVSIVATNAKYSVDACPLRLACKTYLADSELLSGADKAARIASRKRRTPLMHAAHRGNIERLTKYLALGAAIDQIDGKGYAAITYALEAGHEHVAALLLDRGAKPAISAVLAAIRLGFMPLLRSMLYHGADANELDCVTGHTCLTEAILADNEAMVRLLLERGADTEARAMAATPAATVPEPNRVRFFAPRARSRVVPNTVRRPEDGKTPLQLAALLGAGGCVQALLDFGADIDAGRPYRLAMGAVASRLHTSAITPGRPISDYCKVVRLFFCAGAEGAVGAGTIACAARCKDADFVRAILARLFQPPPEAAPEAPAAAAAAVAAQVPAAVAAALDPEHEYANALADVCGSDDADVIRIVVEAVPADVFARASAMAFASFCSVGYQGARPLPIPSTTLLRIAELLLAAGAVVTPRALVNLCSSDPTSASVLQLILEQRPDLKLNLIEPHYGNPAVTLLDMCLSNSHWTSAAVLLHYDAKPSETSLHRLAATECRECLLYHVGQDRPPTAISAMALQRRRAVFAKLVEAGANVAAVDEKGRTVMDVACHNGDAAVMEVLLDSGVKPTRNVVIESIRRCGFDAFRRVLAASGLNSNSGISRNEATECLSRELQVGSHRAVPRTAGDFIASGDRDECLTLAELACIVSETAEYPHEGQAIALHLIERVTNPIRTGLLHIVAAVSDAAVVEALLDKGVPIDARNDAGETALDCAIVATKERWLPFRRWSQRERFAGSTWCAGRPASTAAGARMRHGRRGAGQSLHRSLLHARNGEHLSAVGGRWTSR